MKIWVNRIWSPILYPISGVLSRHTVRIIMLLQGYEQLFGGRKVPQVCRVMLLEDIAHESVLQFQIRTKKSSIVDSLERRAGRPLEVPAQ